MPKETLIDYLLNRLDDHLDELDFQDEDEREEFKILMISEISKGKDLIELCNLMEIPKSKVLEYFDEEEIEDAMIEIYGDGEYNC